MASISAGRLGLAGGSFKHRSRKRWGIAAALAGGWLVVTVVTRSPIASSLLLVLLAAFAGLCLVAMRSLGITRDHPLVRSAATRPWRDGQGVFALGTRHLPDALIITPKGSLLAPSALELRMCPADVDSLTQAIDLDLAHELATEAYEMVISDRQARVLGGGRVEVRIVPDLEVPHGRYVVSQRKDLGTRLPVNTGLVANLARRDLEQTPTRLDDDLPVTELHDRPGPNINPLLQLVTGGSVAYTRVSGARAGRGQAAELLLPDQPTVSRIHARFTCSDGQWRINGLGRNGVLVNGRPVSGPQPVRDGDIISWGTQADALRSRVEIV
jgi:hypothetical protein